ncbi:MAG TPA: J domain-containing protein [Candidatus Limnocylindria bacterium]|nr:J domain-containing protein [Candidatus Limnocylindria bacterium]
MADRQPLDPYAVLGVPRDASPLQLARAHRRLAKRFHPDLNPSGDAERMRRVNEAWALVSARIRRGDRGDAASGTRLSHGSSRHWAGNRRTIRPSPPDTTRTWATWRTTAAETRAAPRTRRQPGEVQIPPTRRPAPIFDEEPRFLDTGWAALIAAAVILIVLLTAVAVGRL